MAKKPTTGRAFQTGEKPRGRSWKPGESGNPAGKPQNTRNKLSFAFLADLCRDWEENGSAVLERVRKQSPAQYMKIVASLVPRQMEVRNHHLIEMVQNMTDDELDRRLRELEAQRSALSAETRTH